MRRAIAVLPLFAFLLSPLLELPTSLLAQTEPGEEVTRQVRQGARVRVTTEDGSAAMVGWIDARDAAGFRLAGRERGTTWVAVDAVRRLETSLGRRSVSQRMMPGIIGGLLVGLVGGFVASEFAVEDCRGGALCFDWAERATIISVGSAAGMLVGGTISLAAVPSEEWAEARLAQEVTSSEGGSP